MKGVASFNFTEDTILNVLVNNNLCSSRREAREFLTAGAIAINNKKITDENTVINKDYLIDNKVLILKKGKKKYYIGYLK